MVIATKDVSEVVRLDKLDHRQPTKATKTHSDLTFLDEANQIIRFTDYSGDQRSVSFFSDMPIKKP